MSAGKRALLPWGDSEWQRWSKAPRYAPQVLAVGSGGFAALKVPLSPEMYETCYDEGAVFTVTMFVERLQRQKRRLVCALDGTLINGALLHDVGDWDDWDVEASPLLAPALGASALGAGAVAPGARDHACDGVPLTSEVDRAVGACRAAWATTPACVVAVYSLDGCNTPGVVAVSLLVEEGATLEAALAAYAVSRPPGIFSQKHVDYLSKRFAAKRDSTTALVAAAPPAWHGDFPEGFGAHERQDVPEMAPPPPRKPPSAAPAAAAAKRPRRAEPAAPPAAAAEPPAAPASAFIELSVVGPDGKSSVIGTFVRPAAASLPASLASLPDKYEKDLVRLASLPCTTLTLAPGCEPRKVSDFLGYLVARKKAAVVANTPQGRWHVEPQRLEANGLKLRCG
ncbi:hypothetical protein M885DRAFT_621291 [Pelagophyceae sp. CCMP2097]|nr:hypothetical protein M885DRAFT_621291 [Pelagophyceae sp. CCMP2097]